MARRKKPKYYTIKSYLIIISFVVIICLPLADNFFHIAPEIIQVENRNLKQFPLFSAKGLIDAGFFKDFDKYFNDNFGFRKYLIRLNSLIGIRWINIVSVSNVIVGKDGWLFYSGEGVMSEYLSRRQLNKIQLLTIKYNLETQKKWLKERGIYFLVVIIPDKQTIYPEFLPSSMKKVSRESDFDQLTKYLKVNSNVEILDLRECLLDAKVKGLLYHPTDTHWNGLGVFYGYSEIVRYLSKKFPGIKSKVLSDFQINCHEGKGKDLANLLALSDLFSDLDVQFTLSRKTAHVILDDSAPDVYITEVNNPVLPSIVILGDSFGEKLCPLLSEHFRRLYFTKWLGGYYKSKYGIIEKEKPDIVILEIVERYVKNL